MSEMLEVKFFGILSVSAGLWQRQHVVSGHIALIVQTARNHTRFLSDVDAGIVAAAGEPHANLHHHHPARPPQGPASAAVRVVTAMQTQTQHKQAR